MLSKSLLQLKSAIWNSYLKPSRKDRGKIAGSQQGNWVKSSNVESRQKRRIKNFFFVKFSTQSYFHCIQLKMHLLQYVKVSKFGCLMFCAESFEFDWWENMFGKVARGNIFQGRRRHFAANQLNSRSKNKNEEELKIWRGGIWMRGIFNHLSGENFACFILMVQPITSNVPRFQARCSPYLYLCAHPHVNQLLSPPSPHSFSPPPSIPSSPHLIFGIFVQYFTVWKLTQYFTEADSFLGCFKIKRSDFIA